MEFIDCPNCARRLRAPDTDGPVVVRCPSCKHVFQNAPVAMVGVPASLGGGGNGAAAQSANEAPAAAAASPAPARNGAAASADPSGGGNGKAVPANGQAKPAASAAAPAARTPSFLTPEDEALLRDFGSGSGLLELTREAYEVSVSGKIAGRTAPSRMPPAAEPLPGRIATQDDLARQHQLVGTALVLANKLVLAHKEEMHRTRRAAYVAWGLVAALAVFAAGAMWYGVWQSGLANTEQVRAAGLPKVADMEAAMKEQRTSQLEASKARETMTEATATIRVLTANLETAHVKLAAATAELDRLRVATQPATQPAK